MSPNPFYDLDPDAGGFVAGDPNVNGTVASPPSPSPSPSPSQRAAPPPAGGASANPFDRIDPPSPQPADKLEGHFGDDMPAQPATRMSPEDEAHLHALYQTGTQDDILAFQHSKGFSTDTAQLAKFVAGRDAGMKGGDDVRYTLAPAPYGDDGRAAVRGAAQGATFGTSDEIHGFLNGVTSLLHGGNYSDVYDRTVDADRAQLGYDTEHHGVQSFLGNLAGGLLTGVGWEKSGLTATKEAIALRAGSEAVASGATAQEAQVIAARAVAKQMAVEGGAFGTAYGVGSGDGGVQQRLTGGIEGGIAGAAGGALLGKLGVRSAANSLVDGAEAPAATDASQVAQAAERQGVSILPQDVGGEGIGRATQGAAQSTFGSPVVRRAADRLYSSFSNRVGELAGDAAKPADAGNIVASQAAQAADRSTAAAASTSGAVQAALGDAPDATGAGQLVQRGVSRFMDDTADKAKQLYDKVPIAAAQPAQLGATRRVLQDMTAEWESNPKLGAIFQNNRLSGYLDALTPNAQKTDTGLLDASGQPITKDVTEGGSLSWQDLSEFRTRVGDMLADPRMSEKIAPRQLRALYGSLTQDMEATAQSASPEALSSWKRANNYYDGRMKRVQNTLSMVVGDRKDATPNEGFSTLQSMLKDGPTGNASAFSRVMRSIPPDDATAVRSAIVSNMRGGPQFDPDKFSGAWGKLSERGKSALLPEPGMRLMMDDAAGRAATTQRNPFAGMSGEQVFTALDKMASNKGDAARFRSTLASLSPEEANTVRSTFIDQGGRAAPGSQNNDGSAFSISRWLTRWNKMSDDAKSTLFGAGELRSNMDDLALLADRVKKSEGLAGHSNTGAVNNFNATTGGLWGATALLLSGHPVLAAGAAAPAAYQRLSAEILTSPRLLRWLTRVPNKPNVAAETAHLKMLSKIAASEPAIGQNVLQLQALLRPSLGTPAAPASRQQGAR